MSDDSKCHECGRECTDRDIVGNQIEFGFPVYWCDFCIEKSLKECEEKGDSGNVEIL